MNRELLETTIRATSSDAIARNLHVFDTIPSTNQTLWELLAQGAEPGTIVIAQTQTSGRGQWGRQWVSPVGGLYLSQAIAPKLPVSHSFHLTLATAWGIASQFRNCGIPVGIKWPNDLVINNRKLGGILTETKIQQGKITKAVVGVGINWANPVPETGINLQSWQTESGLVSIDSLEMLVVITLRGIHSGWQRYKNEGVNDLLPAYLELLTSMGQKLTINHNSGIVVGVTPTGELRVQNSERSPSNSQTTPEEIYCPPGTISLGYNKSSD
ncbi:MAG: biotin--[acetyl-CoA-carboxylase] ligase [Nostocaceae cyanobacterium]|nr:biotin--[acetyl-CoA-carboxylase] ligase [Nostocaceae cyanobacterium]